MSETQTQKTTQGSPPPRTARGIIMANEAVKQKIISVFCAAGKGVHDWLQYSERDELDQFEKAATLIESAKERALERQQRKLASIPTQN